MFASGTIAPWLIGALLLLLLVTTGITAKSWRELKCSPYFFLRRQAMHRMQSYSLVSLCLALVTLVTVAFTWQKPQDDTLRTALIAYAKPILEGEASGEAALGQPAFTAEADEVLPVALSLFELADTAAVHVDLTSGTPVNAETSPSLPAELRRVEATTALKPDTSVSSLTFATNINDRYQPLNPATKFDEGYFTLYATFRYDAMAEGMSWTWVWRHNGTFIEGDNELWKHDGDGPGYVYFRPANGFNPGKYTLEVWVNNELQDQATVTITEGISAGN
jgi:hypothetical protein